MNGSSDTYSAERLSLAVESLLRSGRLRLQVRGASMLPSLWPDDVVEIAACSYEDVKPAEVILAFRDGRFYLHRFQRHSWRGFVARGDALPRPDQRYEFNDLLGRVTSVVRNGRVISHKVHFWTRSLGLLYCYSSMARRLALRWHARRSADACQPVLMPESVQV